MDTIKRVFANNCRNRISVSVLHRNMSHNMRKLLFAYARTKAQISYIVTAQLISAFVFAL